MARQRQGGPRQRTNQRRPHRDRWETLVGWGTPPIYDELGIDVWVKKRRQRDNPAKQTGRRVAPRQPWEDYTCGLDNYCEAISDKEAYILDSLPRPPDKPKPVSQSEITPAKATTTLTEPAKPKAGSGDGAQSTTVNDQPGEATGSKDGVQIDAIPEEAATEELQDAGGVVLEGEGIEDTDRTIPVSVSGRDQIPLTARGELDVGAFSFRSDGAMPPELASRFMLRERIVREAAAGLLPGGPPSGCSSVSRPTTGTEGPLPPPTAVHRPVRLCYSQSNIMLQQPLFPLPTDFPEEDEDEDPVEDDSMSARGTSEERLHGSSRRRIREDGLVSDGGSWSDASDPEDYPSQLLLDEGEQEADAETEVTERWPQLDNRSNCITGHATPNSARSRQNSARMLRVYSAGQMSSAGVSRASARRRAPSGRSGDAGTTTGSGSGGERRPVSLVLKTMVLDSLPDSQRVSLGLSPPAVGSLPFDRSRAHSARSGPSHSSNMTGSTVLPPHITRSVDSKLNSIPGGGGFQGLSNYANPYKDRLPSKGIGIGDLLPAVDTNLRTNLSTRRTPGRRDDRLWLSGGDMTVTGKETLLPYEDSLFLMREGVEMLKMRENSTVLGSAGFRAVTTKTPLHRAQENVHKRLYGHLGRGRSSMQQDEDEDNLSVRANNKRWSSMVSHYSAPPRLTPGTKTTDSATRCSGDSSGSLPNPPAPPSSSNGGNTLSSLYKRYFLYRSASDSDIGWQGRRPYVHLLTRLVNSLPDPPREIPPVPPTSSSVLVTPLSRRRKTRERAREVETGRPQHTLNPTRGSNPVTPRLNTKTRPTPVGPHFRELAQLRT